MPARVAHSNRETRTRSVRGCWRSSDARSRSSRTGAGRDLATGGMVHSQRDRGDFLSWQRIEAGRRGETVDRQRSAQCGSETRRRRGLSGRLRAARLTGCGHLQFRPSIPWARETASTGHLQLRCWKARTHGRRRGLPRRLRPSLLRGRARRPPCRAEMKLLSFWPYTHNSLRRQA